jgi:DNA polymerase-3 subunit epsilon
MVDAGSGPAGIAPVVTAPDAFDAPVAFVDVETTGGHPAWHRVTEVAVVGMRGGEVEWEWSTLVNPGTIIPPSIQRLTGISDDMVVDAPPFAAVAEELASRLAGRRFVAHNVRFDYGFLRAEFRRAGRVLTAPLACTVRLSRELYPDESRHNLDALIARHGLACGPRHRALPDAQVLAQLWRVWRGAWPAQTLRTALERVARRPSLPSQLSPELVDDLPEACGVYRFIGEGDALLYVGKAKNLRERVLGHFGSATRDAKSQRLAAQLRRIEWTETAGELGALLLEARLVRELQPVYNRRLRGGERWTWLFGDDAGPPVLTALDGPLPGGDAFGLHATPRQARNALAKLARGSRLCLKALGLEAGGTGSCFAHQIGRCAGACTGAESPAKHLLRAKLALSSQKLRAWPYDGAVALEETSAQGLRQWHVIDRWQHLGTVHPDAQDLGAAPAVLAPEAGFDADVYRILVRRLTRIRKGLRPWPPGRVGAPDRGPGDLDV